MEKLSSWLALPQASKLWAGGQLALVAGRAEGVVEAVLQMAL
ncbi:hypothetical protein [Methylomarinum vadi]|nr:hypothetical protein [Methylomarinum vadi]